MNKLFQWKKKKFTVKGNSNNLLIRPPHSPTLIYGKLALYQFTPGHMTHQDAFV